jgi:hypothetical protein
MRVGIFSMGPFQAFKAPERRLDPFTFLTTSTYNVLASKLRLQLRTEQKGVCS